MGALSHAQKGETGLCSKDRDQAWHSLYPPREPIRFEVEVGIEPADFDRVRLTEERPVMLGHGLPDELEDHPSQTALDFVRRRAPTETRVVQHDRATCRIEASESLDIALRFEAAGVAFGVGEATQAQGDLSR